MTTTVIDDRTPHLNLPLPNASNFLSEDVPRLREAITAIDTKFGLLDTLLQSDDATLDAVQELVNAIKADRTNITALTSGKADASTVTALAGRVTSLENSVEVEESITLTSGQTVVDLTTLTSTAGATVFVEGVRLRASEWTKHPSIVTRFTLGTSYPAGHIVTVVRRQGGV